MSDAIETAADRTDMKGRMDATGCTVEVVDVSKRIRGTEVLSHVSLTVGAGATVGLAGANGSGKTMLMRAILGLIRPSEGHICIDGQRLWRDLAFPPSAGLLLEGPAFLANRTGLDNLKLLASVRGVLGPEDCEQALADVGLAPGDRRPYRKYSLGMKQRLGVAAALMERPALIVLDEPTNALDATGVELVKGLIRHEQARGATIVLACHAAEVLRELADEVYFLAEGHLDGHETLGNGGGHA